MPETEDSGLLMALLDGALDPTQRAELLARLETEPALAQDLRAVMHAEHLLHQELHAGDGFVQRVLLARQDDGFARGVIRLRQRARRRNRWLLAAMLLLGLGLGLGSLLWPQPPRLPWQLTELSGTVLVGSDGEWRLASPTEALRRGESVRLGSDGALLLSRDGGATRLRLHAQSQLRLEGTQGLQLALEQGSLHAVVAPQDPAQPLLLVAGNARCRVLGTRFQLASSAGRSELQVEEGRVEVAHAGGGTRVLGVDEVLAWNRQGQALRYRLSAAETVFAHDWAAGPPTAWSRGLHDPDQGLTRGSYSKTDDRGVRLVAISGIGPWPRGMGRVERDDRLHLRLRLAQRQSFVVILLGCMDGEGNLRMSGHTVSGIGTDWRDLELPVAAMARIPPEPGARYMHYLVMAPEDAGLELRSLAVQRQQRVGLGEGW